MRMLLVFLFLIGVIVMMMDCAKKSMHLKTSPAHKGDKGGNPATHSSLRPGIFSGNRFALDAEPVPADFARSA